MALLSRDAILACPGGLTKDVPVPAWNGTVRIRSWTIADRDRFYAISKDGSSNASAWLVANQVIDEAGALVFSPEDVVKLEKFHPSGIQVVVDAILDLNRVGEKEIEAAAKN